MSMLVAMCVVMSSCSTDTHRSSTASVPFPVDCGGEHSVTASGSTAQANVMPQFVAAFEKACPGQSLTYEANGSGAGISEFASNTTDFGGTDAPLRSADSQYTKAKERCGSDVWNLPIVFGPVAISYNINAIDTLVLDAPTLAKIFTGQITRWEDPAITARNQSMPPGDIHVVYRSDASGTTDTFQQYLAAASDGVWDRGAGMTFKGGVGTGGAGNEGTAATVKNTEGAITYNEWSFALRQNLFTAKLVTAAGPKPVGISPESVGKTIGAAKMSGSGNDLVLDTSSFNRPTEPGAYPIVLATYEVVCSKYPDPEVGQAVKAFLQAAIGSGQADLEKIGYMPLPPDFRARVSAAVNAIT
jgi:phosphate transport system substrate-binding protein